MDETENELSELMKDVPEETEPEIDAAELLEGAEGKPKARNEPAEEEAPEEKPEGTEPEEKDEQKGDQKAALKERVQADIRTLQEAGWDVERIRELAQSEEAQAAFAKGKGLLSVALAQSGEKNKKSVPRVKAAGQPSGITGEQIERMTDKQFKAFSERIRREAENGRNVRF